MDLRSQRWTLVLGLLACLWGFGMGGAFGAAEDTLKGALQARADGVLATVYGGDAAKAASVVDKSFKYFIRSHLHGGAIGAVALLCGLLLASFRQGPAALKTAAGLLIGAGSLGYSLFWLAAGWTAPALGSTGAAKDALEWWAVPTAGACLVGLALTLVLGLREWFGPARSA